MDLTSKLTYEIVAGEAVLTRVNGEPVPRPPVASWRPSLDALFAEDAAELRRRLPELAPGESPRACELRGCPEPRVNHRHCGQHRAELIRSWLHSGGGSLPDAHYFVFRLAGEAVLRVLHLL